MEPKVCVESNDNYIDFENLPVKHAFVDDKYGLGIKVIDPRGPRESVNTFFFDRYKHDSPHLAKFSLSFRGDCGRLIRPAIIDYYHIQKHKIKIDSKGRLKERGFTHWPDSDDMHNNSAFLLQPVTEYNEFEIFINAPCARLYVFNLTKREIVKLEPQQKVERIDLAAVHAHQITPEEIQSICDH